MLAIFNETTLGSIVLDSLNKWRDGKEGVSDKKKSHRPKTPSRPYGTGLEKEILTYCQKAESLHANLPVAGRFSPGLSSAHPRRKRAAGRLVPGLCTWVFRSTWLRARYARGRLAIRASYVNSPHTSVKAGGARWGVFFMGSPEQEAGRLQFESPLHEVQVPGFYLGRYPVTNEEYARFLKENPGGQLHAVGEKEPNAFGLYDMHGNVWEWVEDDWHGDYKGASCNGQSWVDKSWLGKKQGSVRVMRGGSWDGDARNCRSASRDYDAPGGRGNFVGFRLARFSEPLALGGRIRCRVD